MGEFLTRAISVVAVVVCLNGYNTVLDKREQAEEQLRKQQAELEQEQSVDAAKEGTTTDGAYKDGTYTGEAQGFGGSIDVAVIIENGKISEINITSAEKEDGAYRYHQRRNLQFHRYQRSGGTGTGRSSKPGGLRQQLWIYII